MDKRTLFDMFIEQKTGFEKNLRLLVSETCKSSLERSRNCGQRKDYILCERSQFAIYASDVADRYMLSSSKPIVCDDKFSARKIDQVNSKSRGMTEVFTAAQFLALTAGVNAEVGIALVQ